MVMRRLLSILLVFAAVYATGSCAGPERARRGAREPRYVDFGEASYYAAKFQGRRTASGERYDAKKLTAAHRTLPFGTWVTVVNLKNGKRVRVRVNDRGPFTGGRIIDLSRAAAAKIGLIQAGVGRVRIEVH